MKPDDMRPRTWVCVKCCRTYHGPGRCLDCNIPLCREDRLTEEDWDDIKREGKCSGANAVG